MPKERPIKIAILDHSPDLGGAQVALLTFLKNMDRSRFDGTVILPSRGAFSKALEAINVPVFIVRLPIGLIRLKRGKALQSFLALCATFFFLQFFFLKLWIYLKRNDFQLILTNTIKAHLYGSIAARLCSTPLIWRFHDVLISPDFSPFLVKFISLFGRFFPKKIYAVSKITRDYLAKSGIESHKVEVVYNAIDIELFEYKKDLEGIRNEYRLGEGVRLVGSIGRIIPQKGQKVLLQAIPGVIRRYPEAVFLIVGDVFLKEEAYRNELFEIVKENRIEEKVRFTGFRKDIGNVMRSLDILIFPSVAPEAFPLSVLEAMSLGKPVIASDIGGVGEMIEDGVNGLLVEADHPEQITDRILHLFTNQDLCDKIGKRAKEAVEGKFSLKNYVSCMERACWESAIRREKA